MRTVFLLFLVIGWTSCGSDRINCPRITSDKIKLTSKPNVRRAKPAETLSVSARNVPPPQRKSQLKDPADVDAWDCPRLGQNEKIARDNRRKMDRHFRAEQKRRKKMTTDSLTFDQARLP